MAAFGAVADEELAGGGEGGREGYEGALAAAFHCCWGWEFGRSCWGCWVDD